MIANLQSIYFKFKYMYEVGELLVTFPEGGIEKDF